jgi:hypothetical protein
MITLFTTAKPFLGHSAVIQRNALHSWTLLHPDVEVILFGNDDGAQEVAASLGIRHEPYVERNTFGSKRIDYMFDRAQEIARHPVLCYINCDIILTGDFTAAAQQLQSRDKPFLMVGRRWDTDITQPLDFSNPQWDTSLRQKAAETNNQRPPWWIDYFAFSRGLYLKKIPPLVIGRVYWDNWLIWKAEQLKADVVDASSAVMAIHQNHDYGYHPKGQQGVWTDEQSQQNFQLCGGYQHLRTIESAQYFLTTDGLKSNPLHHFAYFRITFRRIFTKFRMSAVSLWQSWVWHPILKVTRPLRHKLGLRQQKETVEHTPKT